MTIRNLTGRQNEELGKLLIGAAKTIFIAGVVAFLFPGSSSPRPFEWALLGAGISGILAFAGIRILADAGGPGEQKRRRGGRRRWKV